MRLLAATPAVLAGNAPVKVGKGRSHPEGKGSRCSCQNPHDSRRPKLLLQAPRQVSRPTVFGHDTRRLPS